MKQISFLLLLLVAVFGHAQEIVREELSLKNGEIQIPGELSYPKTNEKLPLVIFVHGSGNVDRNGNQEPIIKANYIAQLADSLNAKNIAFYRYDKRTSVKENIPLLKNVVFEDLVGDVIVAIDTFADDDRFSGIHLIGHSQGSLVAMLATNENVKSYTSLAGPGEPISQSIIRQISAQNEEFGQIAKNHLEELMKTDTIQKVNPFLMQLFAPQNQKFIKSWMIYDPSEEIKTLKKPILIVQGAKDLQVTEDDANKLIAAASTTNSGFAASAQLLIIENMNHVLKNVADQTENQASYYDPDFPLSSELLTALVNFIQQHG